MKRERMNILGAHIAANTDKVGFYHVPRKTYDRKLCLHEVTALSPNIAKIYIKHGNDQFEVAVMAKTRSDRGKAVWHFWRTGWKGKIEWPP